MRYLGLDVGKMLKIIWFMLVRRGVYHGFDAENYGIKLSRLSR